MEYKFKKGDRVKIKIKYRYGREEEDKANVRQPESLKKKTTHGTVLGYEKWGTIKVHRDGTGTTSYNKYEEDSLELLDPKEDINPHGSKDNPKLLRKGGGYPKWTVMTEALLEIVESSDSTVRIKKRAIQALEDAGYVVNIPDGNLLFRRGKQKQSGDNTPG